MQSQCTLRSCVTHAHIGTVPHPLSRLGLESSSLARLHLLLQLRSQNRLGHRSRLRQMRVEVSTRPAQNTSGITKVGRFLFVFRSFLAPCSQPMLLKALQIHTTTRTHKLSLTHDTTRNPRKTSSKRIHQHVDHKDFVRPSSTNSRLFLLTT